MDNQKVPGNSEGAHLFSPGDLWQYHRASVGQRLLNYFIDSMVQSFLSFGIYFAFTKIFELSFDADNFFEIQIAVFLTSIFVFLIYYIFCETIFNGRTLGKSITGTKAIRYDGLPLKFKDELLRTFSRIVPFEPLSAFNGNPWHDSWTKTMVIKTR